MPNHAHKKKKDTAVDAKMHAKSYCYNLNNVYLKLVCGNPHLQRNGITREDTCGDQLQTDPSLSYQRRTQREKQFLNRPQSLDLQPL